LTAGWKRSRIRLLNQPLERLNLLLLRQCL